MAADTRVGIYSAGDLRRLNKFARDRTE